jgi:hypothetical protein
MDDGWLISLCITNVLIALGAMSVKVDIHKQLKYPDKSRLQRLFTRGPVNGISLIPIRQQRGRREDLVKTANRALIVFYISFALAILFHQLVLARQ